MCGQATKSMRKIIPQKWLFQEVYRGACLCKKSNCLTDSSFWRRLHQQNGSLLVHQPRIYDLYRFHSSPMTAGTLTKAYPLNSSRGKPSMLFGLLNKHFTISSWTVSGDRCMPQWFKQKHNAQKLQFPSPGGLCIRDRLMWGKSRCNKWSQVIKGIINFLRSSLTPCFFLLMSPVWRLRMLAMLSTENYSSVCSFCFGGTNLTFDVSWFFLLLLTTVHFTTNLFFCHRVEIFQPYRAVCGILLFDR